MTCPYCDRPVRWWQRHRPYGTTRAHQRCYVKWAAQ